MLRCIRCGACMNHCVVYRQIGGHAYGAVYPGPMGAVLTPALDGVEKTRDLPNACTLNGRCQEVCPVGIPLPTLLRGWRETSWREGLAPGAVRCGPAGLGAAWRERPRALPAGDGLGGARHARCSAGARLDRARCRSPAAGPTTATSRPPPGAPSWRSCGTGSGPR